MTGHFKVQSLSVLLSGLLCLGGCKGEQPPAGRKNTVVQSDVDIRKPTVQVPKRSRGMHSTGSRHRSEKKETAPPRRTAASGRVLLPDGSPAVAATVTLWTMDSDNLTTMPWRRISKTLTDEQGRYKLSGRRGDDWGVTVRKDGYAVAAHEDHRRLLHRGPGIVEYTALINLKPAVTIQGKVKGVSSDTGPANVLAVPNLAENLIANELNVLTDDSGNFSISEVPEGSGVLTAVLPGYTNSKQDYSSGQFQEIPSPGKGYKLSGRVLVNDGIYDFATNLTTVTIRSYDTDKLPISIYRTVVSPDATYLVSTVEPEHYTFSLKTDDSAPLYLEPAYIRTTNRQSDRTFDLKVYMGKTVSGVVYEENTSVPLAGVKIFRDMTAWRQNEAVLAETSATGEFTVNGVLEPANIMAASETHYRKTFPKVSVSEGQPVQIEVAPIRYINGHVTTPNGIIPSNLTVAAFKERSFTYIGRPVPCEPDGSFKIPAFDPSITLAATASGYAPMFSESINVEDADVNDVVLALGSGNQIKGSVRSSSGQLVREARVSAHAVNTDWNADDVDYEASRQYYPGRLLAETLTDERGFFVLEDVASNVTVALLAEHPQYAYPALKKTYGRVQEHIYIPLILDDSTSLTVCVTDQNDAPLTGTQVTAELKRTGREKMESVTEVTSATGSVTLSRLVKSTTTTVFINNTNFVPKTLTAVPSGQTIRVRLEPRKFVNFRIRCVDAVTNEPVNCTVSEGNCDPIPVAGKVGEFLLENTRISASYTMLFDAPGYELGSATFKPDEMNSDVITVLMRKPPTLTGRVVDGLTKVPVAGARIQNSLNQKEPFTITGPDGRFSFQPAEITKFVYAVDGEKISSRIDLPGVSNMEYELNDILIFGKEPVRVFVIDEENGPVKGAKVIAVIVNGHRTGSKSEVTNQSGEATFVAYPVETIIAGLLKRGLTEYKDANSYFQVKTLLAPVEAGQNRTITFQYSSASVSGTMYYNDKPVIGGVELKCLTQSMEVLKASALDAGKFRFDNVPPGTYRMTGRASDHRDMPEGELEVTVSAIDKDIVQDIHLKEKDKAFGVTVRNKAGDLVRDAKIVLRDESGNIKHETPSNKNGYGGIWVSEPGNYVVSASHPEYGSSEIKPVVIRNNDSMVTTELILQPSDAEIACQALSYLDGLPIKGASGQLVSGQYIFQSGKNSTDEVVFRHVKPGNYLMTIEADSYGAQSMPVSVQAGDDQHLSIVLMPGGSLSIIVVDNKGQYISNAAITLRPGSYGGITNRSGWLNIENLIPGIYAGQVTTSSGDTVDFNVDTRNNGKKTIQVIVDGN